MKQNEYKKILIIGGKDNQGKKMVLAHREREEGSGVFDED